MNGYWHVTSRKQSKSCSFDSKCYFFSSWHPKSYPDPQFQPLKVTTSIPVRSSMGVRVPHRVFNTVLHQFSIPRLFPWKLEGRARFGKTAARANNWDLSTEHWNSYQLQNNETVKMLKNSLTKSITCHSQSKGPWIHNCQTLNPVIHLNLQLKRRTRHLWKWIFLANPLNILFGHCNICLKFLPGLMHNNI